MNCLILMTLFSVMTLMPQAWGATYQYKSAYRQTMWNNLTDSVHTLGQSPKQAEWTKNKLRSDRINTRINNIKQAKRKAWLNGAN